MVAAKQASMGRSAPGSAVPQQRTLILWSLRHFDDRLLSKESADTVSVVENIKPHGYKVGVVAAFFEVKDRLYLSRTSLRVAIQPHETTKQQGETLQLVMLCWNLRRSLIFVGYL